MTADFQPNLLDYSLHCCNKCKGLFRMPDESLKHQMTCTANPYKSPCTYFACERKIFLQLFQPEDFEVEGSFHPLNMSKDDSFINHFVKIRMPDVFDPSIFFRTTTPTPTNTTEPAHSTFLLDDSMKPMEADSDKSPCESFLDGKTPIDGIQHQQIQSIINKNIEYLKNDDLPSLTPSPTKTPHFPSSQSESRLLSPIDKHMNFLGEGPKSRGQSPFEKCTGFVNDHQFGFQSSSFNNYSSNPSIPFSCNLSTDLLSSLTYTNEESQAPLLTSSIEECRTLQYLDLAKKDPFFGQNLTLSQSQLNTRDPFLINAVKTDRLATTSSNQRLHLTKSCEDIQSQASPSFQLHDSNYFNFPSSLPSTLDEPTQLDYLDLATLDFLTNPNFVYSSGNVKDKTTVGNVDDDDIYSENNLVYHEQSSEHMLEAQALLESIPATMMSVEEPPTYRKRKVKNLRLKKSKSDLGKSGGTRLMQAKPLMMDAPTLSCAGRNSNLSNFTAKMHADETGTKRNTRKRKMSESRFDRYKLMPNQSFGIKTARKRLCKTNTIFNVSEQLTCFTEEQKKSMKAVFGRGDCIFVKKKSGANQKPVVVVEDIPASIVQNLYGTTDNDQLGSTNILKPSSQNMANTLSMSDIKTEKSKNKEKKLTSVLKLKCQECSFSCSSVAELKDHCSVHRLESETAVEAITNDTTNHDYLQKTTEDTVCDMVVRIDINSQDMGNSVAVNTLVKNTEGTQLEMASLLRNPSVTPEFIANVHDGHIGDCVDGLQADGSQCKLPPRCAVPAPSYDVCKARHGPEISDLDAAEIYTATSLIEKECLSNADAYDYPRVEGQAVSSVEHESHRVIDGEFEHESHRVIDGEFDQITQTKEQIVTQFHNVCDVVKDNGVRDAVTGEFVELETHNGLSLNDLNVNTEHVQPRVSSDVPDIIEMTILDCVNTVDTSTNAHNLVDSLLDNANDTKYGASVLQDNSNRLGLGMTAISSGVEETTLPVQTDAASSQAFDVDSRKFHNDKQTVDESLNTHGDLESPIADLPPVTTFCDLSETVSSPVFFMLQDHNYESVYLNTNESLADQLHSNTKDDMLLPMKHSYLNTNEQQYANTRDDMYLPLTNNTAEYGTLLARSKSVDHCAAARRAILENHEDLINMNNPPNSSSIETSILTMENESLDDILNTHPWSEHQTSSWNEPPTSILNTSSGTESLHNFLLDHSNGASGDKSSTTHETYNLPSVCDVDRVANNLIMSTTTQDNVTASQMSSKAGLGDCNLLGLENARPVGVRPLSYDMGVKHTLTDPQPSNGLGCDLLPTSTSWTDPAVISSVGVNDCNGNVLQASETFNQPSTNASVLYTAVPLSTMSKPITEPKRNSLMVQMQRANSAAVPLSAMSKPITEPKRNSLMVQMQRSNSVPHTPPTPMHQGQVKSRLSQTIDRAAQVVKEPVHTTVHPPLPVKVIGPTLDARNPTQNTNMTKQPKSPCTTKDTSHIKQPATVIQEARHMMPHHQSAQSTKDTSRIMHPTPVNVNPVRHLPGLIRPAPVVKAISPASTPPKLHQVVRVTSLYPGEKPDDNIDISAELDVFKCDQCDYTSKKKNQLAAHKSSKHSGVVYSCSEPGCKFQSVYKRNVDSHIRVKHSQQTDFRCGHCSYVTDQKRSLVRHLQHHHLKEKRFKCSDCDYVSMFRNDILEHFRNTHLQQKCYACNQCDYKTSYTNRLKHHLMAHAGIKPYKCSECKYESHDRNIVTRHIRLKHPTKLGVTCHRQDLEFELDAKQFQCASKASDKDIKVIQLTDEQVDQLVLKNNNVNCTTINRPNNAKSGGKKAVVSTNTGQSTGNLNIKHELPVILNALNADFQIKAGRI